MYIFGIRYDLLIHFLIQHTLCGFDFSFQRKNSTEEFNFYKLFKIRKIFFVSLYHPNESGLNISISLYN